MNARKDAASSTNRGRLKGSSNSSSGQPLRSANSCGVSMLQGAAREDWCTALCGKDAKEALGETLGAGSTTLASSRKLRVAVLGKAAWQ
eukprot:5487255-Alexandrium_andersonii.AAC.1